VVKVAVVVPVLNEAEYVPLLVKGLYSLDAEVVVVDGGSVDGTAPALRAAGLRVIDAPRGRARQMNVGAAHTGGDPLLFLHADTRLPEGALAAAVAAVKGGALGGCFRLRIASQNPLLQIAAGLVNLRSRLLHSASGDQALFVTRAAFDQLGGYREVELCEDLDLVERLGRAGRFVCLDTYAETSARRWQKNGVGRTIVLMWALRLGWHLGIPPQMLGRFYSDVR
jgi:rSAM/selenodomain-associated transferase 2